MEVTINPKLTEHLELREKALKQRDPKATYHLAQIYASMKGKKNEKKAYELYKSSATHGYAEAQFKMGICNEKGIGVKPSIRMAITWYIRAEISAASDIADRLDSTDESTRELLHIFREDPGFAEEMDDTAFAKSEPLEYTTIADILCAAEWGDPEAQDWLGHNYYCGANGLEKNYEEAAYWYHKSAEQGSEAGMHHLAQFYKLTEQYKMAVEWYRKYAEFRIRQRREYLGW